MSAWSELAPYFSAFPAMNANSYPHRKHGEASRFRPHCRRTRREAAHLLLFPNFETGVKAHVVLDEEDAWFDKYWSCCFHFTFRQNLAFSGFDLNQIWGKWEWKISLEELQRITGRLPQRAGYTQRAINSLSSFWERLLNLKELFRVSDSRLNFV